MTLTTNQAERVIKEWNEKYPPGTSVILKNDLGLEIQTITTSDAWIICQQFPVVKVKGRSGGYDLRRIRPVYVAER